MRYEYTVSMDDFVRSLRAWRRLSAWRRVVFVFSYWLFPSSLVVLAGYFLYLGKQAPEGQFATNLFAGIFLFVAATTLVTYRLRVRHAYKQRVALTKGGPMFVDFDMDGIRFVVPEGAAVHYKWSAFTSFDEDEKVATLFVTQAAFHTIPKRAMPAEVWSELRALLNPHIKS